MMIQEEDFIRLEKNVEKLLSNIDRVQKENIALQESLRRMEEENNALREEMSHLKDDKVDVHKRVTGLIDAIEKWEKEYASPGEEGVSAEADSPESGHDQETVS